MWILGAYSHPFDKEPNFVTKANFLGFDVCLWHMLVHSVWSNLCCIPPANQLVRLSLSARMAPGLQVNSLNQNC